GVAHRNLFDSGDGTEQFHDIVRALGGEKGDTKAETALAFHVDRQQIRAGGHGDPEFAPAQGRIADVGGEGGEDAAGNAAVAVGFAGAEDGVGLVDDDDDGAERANGHEDAGLLAFGVAHPFGTELAHFHYRQAAFAGETIDEEGFADADAAGDEHAAFDDVGLAVFDEPGQFAEFFLGGGVSGDEIQGDAGARVFETDQALAIFLDQAFFSGGDVLLGDAGAVADGLSEQVLRAQQVKAGAARGQLFGIEIAPITEGFAAGQIFGPARLQKAKALIGVG